MKNYSLLLLILSFSLFSESLSSALESYEKGMIASCRKNLSYLNRKFKHNSNVLYLNGLLAKTGTDSYKAFKKIAEEFPKSSKYKIAKKKINDFLIINQILEDKKSSKSEKKDQENVSVSEIVKDLSDHVLLEPETKEEFFKSKTVYLQLGAFQNKKNAEKLVEKTDSFQTFIKEFQVTSGKSFYRVLTGPLEKDSKDYYQKKNALMEKHNLTPIDIYSENL